MKRIIYNLNKGYNTLRGALKKNSLHAYWWDARKNFGDLLTPELLFQYGHTPIHRYPVTHESGDWIMVGSLIQMLPDQYGGNIIGSGLIREKSLRLPNARIWSVRGELTKRAMGLPPSTPTGDLGLLADRLLPRSSRKTHAIGLIPHYADKNHDWVRRFTEGNPNKVLCIDVERPARDVIEDIARCEVVASSSLHGLIVADSLQIPNVWLAISSDAVIGGDFKFHDYFSSLDVTQDSVSCLHINSPLDIQQQVSLKNIDTIARKKTEIETLLTGAIRH